MTEEKAREKFNTMNLLDFVKFFNETMLDKKQFPLGEVFHVGNLDQWDKIAKAIGGHGCILKNIIKNLPKEMGRFMLYDIETYTLENFDWAFIQKHEDIFLDALMCQPEIVTFFGKSWRKLDKDGYELGENDICVAHLPEGDLWCNWKNNLSILQAPDGFYVRKL